MQKLFITFLMLLALASGNLYSQVSDVSPIKSTTTSSNSEAVYDLLFNYSVDSLTAGTGGYGVVYSGSRFFVSNFNAATMYKINRAWDSYTSVTATGLPAAAGFRDMALLNGYIWGLANGTSIYKMDTATFTVVKTVPFTGWFPSGQGGRGIAWDPVRNGFWICSFGSDIKCVDTNGVVIASATIPATGQAGKHGLGYDNVSPGGPFIWATVENSVTTNIKLVKYSAVTLSKVDSAIVTVPLTIGASTGLAGGGVEMSTDVVTGKNVLVGLVQGTPDRVIGIEISNVTPPPGGGDTVLVVLHDTVGGTTGEALKRKQDRDTLNKYLDQMVRGPIKRIYTDSTTQAPSLTNYKTIIVQETGFDTFNRRFMSYGFRQSLKAWLNSGTTGSKKSLLMIGADLGYNYDRSAAAVNSKDTNFTRTYGKFVYKDDGSASMLSVVRITDNVTDNLTGVDANGYYPDACGVTDASAIKVYRYGHRTANDSLAGIMNNQPGYIVASMFQDPRYFSAATTGQGFGRVLRTYIDMIIANGGVITGTGNNNNIATTPDSYTLSQNYPNPFNPTTNINFTMPKSGVVSLKVYDILGKEVMTLVNEFRSAGAHTVNFNASRFASGTYFYRLETNGFVDVKKMMLVK